MNEENLSFEEKKARVLALFKENRKNIAVEVKEHVAKLQFISGLADAQVTILSMRQRLLEDMHTLIENVRSLENQLRAKKAGYFEELSKGQMLYKDREKAAFVEGKTTDLREMLQIFKDQVDFYSDSIKTLDGAHYGVRYRIDIEKAVGM